ncbi:hypothetical protein BC629DRAFT_1588855 [Irpex lacteus]|nr:hypothetical protein BC629DRAFT_1588855 [Irpex lacteus]
MTSPSSPNPLEPPSYVLVSHSLTAPSAAGPSTTLSHATIEYHYADDSPHDLLPRTPGEHVLVLDYDPAHVPAPTAQSLSPDLAVKGVKVADAPGAGVAAEEGPRNNKIYVIETSVTPIQSVGADEQQAAQTILADLKQRNTNIRHILDYPSGSSEPAKPQMINGRR